MIPFLFTENRKVFVLTSILGILGVCMTYQASSGIYIVFVLIIAFSQWIKGEKLKETVSFVITAAVSFIVTLLVFRLVFMFRVGVERDFYVSTNILSLGNFFPGILANANRYVLFLWNALGRGAIKIFGLVLCVLFLFISVKKTKHNKLLTFIISLFVVFIMFVLSYGAYLVLELPIWASRAFCGFGIFIAAISVYCITMLDKLEKSLLKVTAGLSVILLSYSMIVFAFSYGNALIDEKRYAEFRTTLMISDLTRYIDISQKPSIQIVGNIGYTPAIKNIGKIYPLIYKLVYAPLAGGTGEKHKYLEHYNFDYIINESDNPEIEYTDFSSSDLPLLTENSYHIIKGESETGRFLVLLKEGKK